MVRKLILSLFVFGSLLFSSNAAKADFILAFEASDFTVTPTFSDVQNFNFRINIAGAVVKGGTYNNPTLNGVEYLVFGSLAAGTPSGFSGFFLDRTIGGAEFYNQGSSLNFSVSATADLSDGLQVSELVGTDPVFVLNAREVDTGRYHPPLVQLNSDGTGSIRNSNNMGGVNPATMEVVDVDFGEEYISNLSFDPATTTIGTPEPSTPFVLAIIFAATALRRRKKMA